MQTPHQGCLNIKSKLADKTNELPNKNPDLDIYLYVFQ